MVVTERIAGQRWTHVCSPGPTLRRRGNPGPDRSCGCSPIRSACLTRVRRRPAYPRAWRASSCAMTAIHTALHSGATWRGSAVPAVSPWWWPAMWDWRDRCTPACICVPGIGRVPCASGVVWSPAPPTMRPSSRGRAGRAPIWRSSRRSSPRRVIPRPGHLVRCVGRGSPVAPVYPWRHWAGSMRACCGDCRDPTAVRSGRSGHWPETDCGAVATVFRKCHPWRPSLIAATAKS